MLQIIRAYLSRIVLLINRGRFHLLFTRIPGAGAYCNSKRIAIHKVPIQHSDHREILIFVRCGGECALIDDGGKRNFDIALNLFAGNPDGLMREYEYVIAGGINKFKAARQFLDDDLLSRYTGFMFLDDDLEMTYSELSGFLRYCKSKMFTLAQPSLTHDSYCSHGHLVNTATKGWRHVDMIEVMCPYFSRDALKSAICTFDLSYSTWGLDYIWPRLPGLEPVVVDRYVIKHTRPVDANSPFYRYMKQIGISPAREAAALRKIPLNKLISG